MLYEGSAHHLWFLPFIMVLTIVAFGVAKMFSANRSTTTTHWLAFGGLVIAGFIAGLDAPGRLARWYWLNRAWAASPAILWAFAIALVYPRMPDSLWHSRTLTMVCGLAWIALVGLCVLLSKRLLLVENLAGLAFFIIAVTRLPAPPAVAQVAKLGSLAYGIYLCHIMFIEGLQAVAARLGVRGVGWLDLLVFVVASGASVSLAWVLTRRRLGRWLAPA
jgi:peptidoglycan/LPS O-acetylase OafA/YrhL